MSLQPGHLENLDSLPIETVIEKAFETPTAAVWGHIYKDVSDHPGEHTYKVAKLFNKQIERFSNNPNLLPQSSQARQLLSANVDRVSDVFIKHNEQVNKSFFGAIRKIFKFFNIEFPKWLIPKGSRPINLKRLELPSEENLHKIRRDKLIAKQMALQLEQQETRKKWIEEQTRQWKELTKSDTLYPQLAEHVWKSEAEKAVLWEKSQQNDRYKQAPPLLSMEERHTKFQQRVSDFQKSIEQGQGLSRPTLPAQTYGEKENQLMKKQMREWESMENQQKHERQQLDKEYNALKEEPRKNENLEGLWEGVEEENPQATKNSKLSPSGEGLDRLWEEIDTDDKNKNK